MPWGNTLMKNTRSLLLIPLFILFLFPGVIWIQQTGDIRFYFSNSVPDGQLLYVLSKLTGLYAFFFLMIQILVSLSSRYQVIPLPWISKLHKIGGSFVFLLSFLHLLLFFSAVSLRQEQLALGLLVPNLSDFYHTQLTFGLIGLWLLLLVVVTGLIRTIRKSQYAPMIHRVCLFSTVLIYLHVLAIGSESQSNMGLALYINLGLLFIVLLYMVYVKKYRMSAENR